MELFFGCGTALATPFNEGVVDFAALEALLERQVRAGVQAVVVLGSTGEPATVLPEERRDIIACAAAKLPRGVQLIAGAGANSTRTAVRYAEQAEKLGADALLVVNPYYNKASDEGLLRHFGEIARSVTLPIILYNVPSRTGQNLSPELALRLMEHPRITGIKEASGSLEQLMRLAELMGSDKALYAGNDGEILPALALGARGVISMAANLVPEAICALTGAWRNGAIEECLELQLRLLPLVRALTQEVNPIPLKAALGMMGLARNELRLPLCPLASEKEERLRAAMAAFAESMQTD